MTQKYLNAYQNRDEIVAVYRDDAGVLQEDRFQGEQVAFFNVTDVTLAMKKDKRVLKWSKDQHGWARAVFKSGYWDADKYNKWTKKPGCWISYREVAVKEWGVPSYEADVSAIKRWFAEGDFGIARPHRAYFDIETDSRVKIDKAIEGEARVLVWSVVDEAGTAWSGCLEADTDEAESILLDTMWGVLDKFDVVSTWNGDRFDIPIIKLRSKLHGLQPEAMKRLLFIDQLVLFRKNNTMSADSGEEKASFKLGDIAMGLLGEGKHDVDASKAYEMWAAGGADREKLVHYCIQDTDLLRRIEGETGYLELFQTVAEVTGVFPNTRGISPSSQVDSFMLKLGAKKGVHFKTKWYDDDSIYEKYEGAFVMEPNAVGIVRDVYIADFASLYPSIMITFNISPEMKDMQRGTCKSPGTGVLTRTENKGLICEALEELLALRAVWKKKKAAAPPGSEEEKAAERRTNAYKIAANSFYGTVGMVYSRFFDKELSESTTLNGKWLILETNAEAERRGWRVIYSDTDSTFVTGVTNEAAFEEFITYCNTTMYPKMLADLGCRTNAIKLASDKYLERVVFTAKKRYMAKQKGNDKKPVIKGLEVMRGDVNRIARQMQKEVIMAFFHNDLDPATYERIVHTYRERIAIEPMDRDLVVISKSVKDLGDYTSDLPQVRIAKIMKERGEDIREGTKVSYVIIDGYASPMKVIPADDYKGEEVDRDALWNFAVFPASMRLLQAMIPEVRWERYHRASKSVPKHRGLEGQTKFSW